MAIHVFTSITSSYLPKARVLADGAKRMLPGCVFHLLLADAVPLGFDLCNEPFDYLISIDELGIRNVEQWVFQHSVVEACTGLKGFVLKRLLSRRDCDAVLFFDPDVVILSPLWKLLEQLDQSAVLLTPHLTEPEVTPEAILDNEFSVLQHGIYNLGFLGVRASAEGRRFADWWANRLELFCYDDIPRGLFTDQRWADLAPAYFDGLKILRDPGYNVCTWNLTHRRVLGNLRNGFTVNGGPLYFYHFSGLDSGAQKAMLDRYGSEMPALYDLRKWYLAECERMGQRQFENIPWSYDFFDNGERIRPLHRKLYRERPHLQSTFPNPFVTREISRSYYHWFEANEADGAPGSGACGAPPGISLKAEATLGEPPARSRELHYRVYLSVCMTDPGEAAAFAKDLLTRTYQSANFHIVGPRSILHSLKQSVDPTDSPAALTTPEGASHEEAFAAVVKECGGKWDFIFLTPDVVAPDLWDLRLAWTAERISGVATVSPISESCSWTRLPIASSRDSVDLIDRACHSYCLLRNPEIPEFFPDCFYVRREAVRDVLTKATSLVTFRNFGQFCRQFRWAHVLADHVYTGTTRELTPAQPSLGDTLLEDLAAKVSDLLAGNLPTPPDSIRKRAMARQLHVLHSWGGGLERWVAEFCRADRSRTNLVLKSVGGWGAFGQELHLYENIEAQSPIQRWALSPEIKHTAITHSGYQAALAEIVDRYGIDNILVSSLIGHSLDALETSAPATLIAHDFYPFCPALNITFGTVCSHCTESDLHNCTEANVHHRFFRNVPPAEWIELRKAFSQRVLRGRVPIIAPSPSVPRHYAELAPELKDCFKVIPHGVRRFEAAPVRRDYPTGQRLRIVILGSLAPQKGLDLLRRIQARLRSFADLFLLGCGEHGVEFEGMAGVVVIPQYDWQELPGLLQSIRPDLGLLLSVVPETFSYTLQELMNLAIPPVATRLGSFSDWVEDGVNGFLCDPAPAAIIARLEGLNAQRNLLAGVHNDLRGRHQRGVWEMVADYERVLELPSLSGRAYFDRGRADQPPVEGSVDFRLVWRTALGEFGDSAGGGATGGAGNQVINITIPELVAGPSQLRLDFGNEPGFVVLFRMRLYSSEMQCLWSWEWRRGLPGGVWENIQLLANSPGLLLHPSSSCPRWLLPIKDADLLPLERGGKLEIEFSNPSIEKLISVLSSSILANQTGEVAQHREGLRQVLQSLDARMRDRPSSRSISIERLVQRLSNSQTRVEDLENSLSWRITAPLRWAGAEALKLSRRMRLTPSRLNLPIGHGAHERGNRQQSDDIKGDSGMMNV